MTKILLYLLRFCMLGLLPKKMSQNLASPYLQLSSSQHHNCKWRFDLSWFVIVGFTLFFAEQSRARSRPNGIFHCNSEPKRRLCTLSPQFWTCGRTTSGMAWSLIELSYVCRSFHIMRMVYFSCWSNGLSGNADFCNEDWNSCLEDSQSVNAKCQDMPFYFDYFNTSMLKNCRGKGKGIQLLRLLESPILHAYSPR